MLEPVPDCTRTLCSQRAPSERNRRRVRALRQPSAQERETRNEERRAFGARFCCRLQLGLVVDCEIALEMNAALVVRFDARSIQRGQRALGPDRVEQLGLGASQLI
eukprot:3798183-Rhodomonas_salina.1